MNQTELFKDSAALNYVFNHPLILFLIIAWMMAWKGLALWKAGRLSHKWWFIVLLVSNTFGILEIIYIYFIARKFVVETETEEIQEHVEIE